jgi:O-methyltransferase
MFTDSSTTTPWSRIIVGSEIDSAVGFNKTNLTLKSLIDDRRFVLSQFSHLPLPSLALDVLAWRHYIVYWSALSAAKATRAGTKNLVETGTCDGLTAYFAMSALKDLGTDFKCYMYDAWEPMKGSYLLEGEESKRSMYDYLEIENTIANLQEFSEAAVFNKGYIPDSFSESKSPEELVWLHVDLNSAAPTLDTLEYFYERILPGGIILFDDYAFHDHALTKELVDTFFSTRKVNLLQLPTGQAITFKI